MFILSRRKHWGSLVAICFCILLFGACSRKRSGEKNIFYWNIASSFTSMDPVAASSQANTWVVNQLYDGMLRLDDSLQPAPCIAKSWKVSNDGLQYRFSIRNDVVFHDDACFPSGKGRKLTAADVVYSLKRLVDPQVAAKGAWVLNDKVAKDRNGNPRISAEGDSIVEINLTKRNSSLLSLLTLKYCSIVPHEAISKYGKNFRMHPVGTGPYRLAFFREAEKLVLHPHTGYFLAGDTSLKPRLSAVVITFNGSKQNEFISFLSGRLSFLSGMDAGFKDILLTKSGQLKEDMRDRFRFVRAPYLNTEYLGIILDAKKFGNSPLQSTEFRQALNVLIDREKMLQYTRNGVGIGNITGFVPPSLMPKEVQNVSAYRFNVSKGKALLALAAKQVDIHAPFTLYTTNEYSDLAIYLQREYENYGLRMKIENVPGASLSELKSSARADFIRASWVADYPDADNYFSLFNSQNFTPSGDNYFHFYSKKFDKLYAGWIGGEGDEKQLLIQMNNEVNEICPFVILYYDEVIRLVQNNVRGLKSNPMNMVDLRGVYFSSND